MKTKKVVLKILIVLLTVTIMMLLVLVYRQKVFFNNVEYYVNDIGDGHGVVTDIVGVLPERYKIPQCIGTKRIVHIQGLGIQPKLKTLIIPNSVKTFIVDLKDICNVKNIYIGKNVSVFNIATLSDINLIVSEDNKYLEYKGGCLINGTTVVYCHKNGAYIPENATSIAQSVYSGSDITLDSGSLKNITEIHSRAFGNCLNISSVYLPDGLEYISDAFVGCESLRYVYIPASVLFLKINEAGAEQLYNRENITPFASVHPQTKLYTNALEEDVRDISLVLASWGFPENIGIVWNSTEKSMEEAEEER